MINKFSERIIFKTLMFWKVLAASFIVIFGLGVLFTSILRSSAVRYSFYPASGGEMLKETEEDIIYELPSPGRVLPDSPFWILKVARDRAWLILTPNKLGKGELNLFFADKRLVFARILFEKGKYELGTAILLKAEKYLKEASLIEEDCRSKGYDTREFDKRLTISSLKHREVINKILVLAPENARPEIIKMENITREVFVNGRNALQEKGEVAPKSPSEWN